jgi:hypothetical protein
MKTTCIPLFGLAMALVSFANATQNIATKGNKCSTIEVRKEWRALSKREKKGWIDAVNVSPGYRNHSSLAESFLLVSALVSQSGAPVGETQATGQHLRLLAVLSSMNDVIPASFLYLLTLRQIPPISPQSSYYDDLVYA